jgi:3-deoxy-manno-octulosonate cytidylyltransferase (CMP-KDO synthetase)
MQTTIIIPARLQSTRLPEKALSDILGKPMIHHVVQRARAVSGVSRIFVATDDDRIAKSAREAGADFLMTPSSLQSGTERVAHAAELLRPSADDVFVNVQGDEPLLDPSAVDGSLELVRSGQFGFATAAAELKDSADLANPNVVKVLVSHEQRAVYFSRHSIPHSRMQPPGNKGPFACRHHLGIYAYNYKTLQQFAALPKTEWELAESLEQLRALYFGIAIGVAEAKRASIGVDTEADLQAVREQMKTAFLS